MAGSWEGPIGWLTQAIHMIHAPSASTYEGAGKLLFWDFGVVDPPNYTSPHAYLWDGTWTSIAESNFATFAQNLSNMFCGGHCHLEDGRVLVAGGHEDNEVGSKKANLFTALGSSPGWAATTGEMTFKRWYPTCTQLADNRVMVMGGSESANPTVFVQRHEIWDPTTGLFSLMPTTVNRLVEFYPWNFVIPVPISVNEVAFPAGSLFFAGPLTNCAILNWAAATPVWSSPITPPWTDPILAGSAVMYEPGKIMACGGSKNNVIAASGKTYIIDLTQDDPTWSQLTGTNQSMAHPRREHNLVLLPDGRVLAIGGVLYGADAANYFLYPNQVYIAEIWDPTSKTWSDVELHIDPRWYHSVAQLMRDARVFASGGNGYNSSERYTPNQYTHTSRPVITSCPAVIHYGTQFELALAASSYTLSKVTLLKLGAATHGFDQSQRFLNLVYATNGVGTITPPANANYAPPGYYMLFAFYTIGGVLVPSLARYVQLTA